MRTAEQAARDRLQIENLITFLRARFEEDRAVAVAASSAHGHMTPTGEHWRWSGGHDEEIIIDSDAYLRGVLNVMPNGEWTNPGLWSEEEYPSGTGRPLGHFVLSTDDEVDVAVGDHIVRQSPAYVIDDIEAKLAMLDAFDGSDDAWVVELLARFALRYQRHPGWQTAYRLE